MSHITPGICAKEVDISYAMSESVKTIFDAIIHEIDNAIAYNKQNAKIEITKHYLSTNGIYWKQLEEVIDLAENHFIQQGQSLYWTSRDDYEKELMEITVRLVNNRIKAWYDGGEE